MPGIKSQKRVQRFGVLLDMKYREFLYIQAIKSHRSAPKYVEWLLDRHKLEIEAGSQVEPKTGTEGG